MTSSYGSRCTCFNSLTIASDCPVHSATKPPALEDPRHAMWEASQPKPSAPTAYTHVPLTTGASLTEPPKDAGAREWWIFPDNIHERDIFEAPMHEHWKKYGYVPVHVIEYAAYEELEREQVQHIDLLAKQYEAELTQARAELLTCKGDLACVLTDLSEVRADLANEAISSRETALEARLEESERLCREYVVDHGRLVAQCGTNANEARELQDKLSAAEARCKELEDKLRKIEAQVHLKGSYKGGIS